MVDTEPTIVAFVFEGILLVAGKEKLTICLARKYLVIKLFVIFFRYTIFERYCLIFKTTRDIYPLSITK